MTDETQILTWSKHLKLVRNFITLEIDAKGVSLGKVVGRVKYNYYYSRIYTFDYLNLKVVNDLLKIYLCNYKIELINNEIHKVFQSKMNEI